MDSSPRPSSATAPEWDCGSASPIAGVKQSRQVQARRGVGIGARPAGFSRQSLSGETPLLEPQVEWCHQIERPRLETMLETMPGRARISATAASRVAKPSNRCTSPARTSRSSIRMSHC